MYDLQLTKFARSHLEAGHCNFRYGWGGRSGRLVPLISQGLNPYIFSRDDFSEACFLKLEHANPR